MDDEDPDRDGSGAPGTDQSNRDERSEPLPAPVLGDADAPVTVTVFGDFECTGCRAFHEHVLPHLRRDYVEAGVVRFEHRDYPRPGEDDPEIYRAASAARAVQDELGDDAFFEYASDLFANQGNLGPERYRELAAGVGADADSVARAAETRRYRATVERDRELGEERGVGAVPAVFVGDEEFTGTTLDGLTDLIDRHRQ